MTRTCLPRRPPALLISSTAISMPFLVEMPNVAVVPVSDPYSPTTISELESDFAPAQAVNASTLKKPKRSSHGLRVMNPPSARIPEGLAILPLWFFVLIFLCWTMVVRAGRLAAHPLGSGVLLSCLLVLLVLNLLRVIFSNLPFAYGNVLRHVCLTGYLFR